MIGRWAEVVRKGDRNGNGMIVRFRFPSGREILGFGTETISPGEGSLGPTWCYFVPSPDPSGPSFLFDCGWRNLGGRKILGMMEAAGYSAADLDCIVISHCHEDHDGGLAELVQATGVPVRSHPAHALLTRFYPDKASSGARADFPASCWNCMMPASFSEKHCRSYHRERSGVPIGSIEGFGSGGIEVYHTPGHSPDAISITLGGDAILAGDTVLPGITPHPSREAIFRRTGPVLASLGMRADQLYGIRAYIRTLKKLLALGSRRPDMLVLPAHRLYHDGRWNGTTLKERAEALIDHHLQRCAAFLEALKDAPRTTREVAEVSFEPRLLKDMGIHMAVNEVLCHFELLALSGDAVLEGEKYAATGTAGYRELIDSLGEEG